MDPLSLAMIPATLVGLLHTWKSERETRKDATITEWLEWLRRHNFEQLAKLIQQNADLNRAVSEVLRSNHDEVMAALGRIEQVVSELVSHDSQLRPIGALLQKLPEQALAILQQMEKIKCSRLLIYRNRGGIALMPLDGNGRIDIDFDRFLEADLDTLETLGLLGKRHNAKGEPVYTITRAGASLGAG